MISRLLLAIPAVASIGGALAGKASLLQVEREVTESGLFQRQVDEALPVFCKGVNNLKACRSFVSDALICLELASKYDSLSGGDGEKQHCMTIDQNLPSLVQLSTILASPATHREEAVLLQQTSRVEAWARSSSEKSKRRKPLSLRQSSSHGERRKMVAPEDELAKEMTHDLEMNFNKIAPFGKEDTAKELQDHAAKTQDTLVDAVENAEVAEIKRAVFRALTRLRAATIKEFDTIARLETQAIDAYNDAHHYRAENPLAHLHEDEAPVETDKLKSFH